MPNRSSAGSRLWRGLLAPTTDRRHDSRVSTDKKQRPPDWYGSVATSSNGFPRSYVELESMAQSQKQPPAPKEKPPEWKGTIRFSGYEFDVELDGTSVVINGCGGVFDRKTSEISWCFLNFTVDGEVLRELGRRITAARKRAASR